MKIVNLTPHSINILDENGNEVMLIEPSGKLARLESEKELIMAQRDRLFKHDIPFFITKYGIPVLLNALKQPVQFPEQKESIIYIVSGLFRAGYPRADLWQPGELVRNDKGQPIGCIGLSQ